MVVENQDFGWDTVSVAPTFTSFSDVAGDFP